MSNSDMSFLGLLNERANELKIPFNGTFELTTRCNLNCVMCYTQKSPNNKQIISSELSKEQIIAYAKDARDLGMVYALLTGGEVLLRKDFKEIYETFTELGLLVTIFTNGTLIDRDVVEWLSKRPPNLISITLYGASAETYKKITGNYDGFSKAINAIDLLLERKINVEIKTILLKDNKNEFNMFEEIANSRGLRLGIVNYVFPSIECNSSDPIGHRLDPKTLAHVFEVIENETQYDNFESNDMSLNVINQGSGFDCSAGKSSFTLTWDGKLRGCGILEDLFVDMKNQVFKDAFNKLNDNYTQIKRYNECDSCEYLKFCITCPARRKIETGSYYEKPSYLCEYAHEISLQKSKFHE